MVILVYDGFKMSLPPRCSMFVKTNIGLHTPTHPPPEIQDQSSLFRYKVNKFSKGRRPTFSSIISMRGHEWVKIVYIIKRKIFMFLSVTHN